MHEEKKRDVDREVEEAKKWVKDTSDPEALKKLRDELNGRLRELGVKEEAQAAPHAQAQAQLQAAAVRVPQAQTASQIASRPQHNAGNVFARDGVTAERNRQIMIANDQAAAAMRGEAPPKPPPAFSPMISGPLVGTPSVVAPTSSQPVVTAFLPAEPAPEPPVPPQAVKPEYPEEAQAKADEAKAKIDEREAEAAKAAQASQTPKVNPNAAAAITAPPAHPDPVKDPDKAAHDKAGDKPSGEPKKEGVNQPTKTLHENPAPHGKGKH